MHTDTTTQTKVNHADKDITIQALQEEILELKMQLQAHQKTTKNSLKVSIVVGFFCFFFVALNFSILFTVTGGVAGGERKIQALQHQTLQMQETLINLENKMRE